MKITLMAASGLCGLTLVVISLGPPMQELPPVFQVVLAWLLGSAFTFGVHLEPPQEEQEYDD